MKRRDETKMRWNGETRPERGSVGSFLARRFWRMFATGLQGTLGICPFGWLVYRLCWPVNWLEHCDSL